jgi:hypothetical protein
MERKKRIEGNDITQIINRIKAQHDELFTTHPKLIVDINTGGTGIMHEYSESDPMLKALDKWKEYIYYHYRSVELELPQMEDIFRYLCHEHIWIEIEAKKEKRDSWNRIIDEIIKEIENETNFYGLFKKIINEIELLVE